MEENKVGEYVFPTLGKEYIEARVGMVKPNSGYTLLLYQDARVGMTILDNVVGQANWQRKHYELKGHIYCSLGIRNPQTGEWVWKDDAGAETEVEKEKGEASDSFKRACVLWGIGRCLYNSPFIWVNDKTATRDTLKYKRFEVIDIEYDEKQVITKLVINDDEDNCVFAYPKSARPKNTQKVDNGDRTMQELGKGVADTFNTLNDTKGSIKPEQQEWLNKYLERLTDPLVRARFFSYIQQNADVGSINLLSERDAQAIINNLSQRKARQ